MTNTTKKNVGTKVGESLACKIKMPEDTYTLMFKTYGKKCGALNLPVPEGSRAAFFFFLFLNLTLLCFYLVLED